MLAEKKITGIDPALVWSKFNQITCGNKDMRNSLITLSVVLSFLSGAAFAAPITIDFTGVNDHYANPYSEDGFDLFRDSYNHWHIHSHYNGTGALSAHSGADLSIKKSDGGIFDFSSFYLWGNSSAFTVTSNLGDVFNTVSGTVGNYVFDWVGVSQINITHNGHINLDDIVLNGTSVPVPEPATIALFCLGLLGLGFSRKRAL